MIKNPADRHTEGNARLASRGRLPGLLFVAVACFHVTTAWVGGPAGNWPGQTSEYYQLLTDAFLAGQTSLRGHRGWGCLSTDGPVVLRGSHQRRLLFRDGGLSAYRTRAGTRFTSNGFTGCGGTLLWTGCWLPAQLCPARRSHGGPAGVANPFAQNQGASVRRSRCSMWSPPGGLQLCQISESLRIRQPLPTGRRRAKPR